MIENGLKRLTRMSTHIKNIVSKVSSTVYLPKCLASEITETSEGTTASTALLDEEVKKIFYPLNLTANMFFLSKYFLRDNLATPLGKKYFVLLLIVQIVYLFGITTRAYFAYIRNEISINNSKNIALKLIYCVFVSISFVCICVSNFCDRKRNIEFIKKIQLIHNCVKISKNVKIFGIWSWLIGSISIGIDLTLFAIFYSKVSFNFIIFMADILYMGPGVNFAYAVNVIVLLRIYLEKWNDTVSKLEEEENEVIDRVLEGYNNIIEAYRMYKSLFQATILQYLMDAFFRTLIYLQIVIQLSKMPEILQASIAVHIDMGKLMMIVWLVKDLIMIFILSYQMDKFYKAIEDAKTVCIIRFKNAQCTSLERRLYKAVIRTDYVFSKLRVFGLFNVVAVLPLQMVELIDTYVIVLLQFAFT